MFSCTAAQVTIWNGDQQTHWKGEGARFATASKNRRTLLFQEFIMWPLSSRQCPTFCREIGSVYEVETVRPVVRICEGLPIHPIFVTQSVDQGLIPVLWVNAWTRMRKVPDGGQTHGSEVSIPTLAIVGQHTPTHPISRLYQGDWMPKSLGNRYEYWQHLTWRRAARVSPARPAPTTPILSGLTSLLGLQAGPCRWSMGIRLTCKWSQGDSSRGIQSQGRRSFSGSAPVESWHYIALLALNVLVIIANLKKIMLTNTSLGQGNRNAHRSFLSLLETEPTLRSVLQKN